MQDIRTKTYSSDAFFIVITPCIITPLSIVLREALTISQLVNKFLESLGNWEAYYSDSSVYELHSFPKNGL
jgi:hypothetical protein